LTETLSLRSLTFDQDNAPLHKSLVAQQAVCDCEFFQLDHPAYSPDLAASNYFLIRNVKYHLRGTWFIDDELLNIVSEAWFENRNRKIYFQGIKSSHIIWLSQL